MTKPPFPQIDELLQRLLDDQIQPEEMERLQKAIREDVRVLDYYIDSMLACAVVRRSSQVTGELGESDLIQALSGDKSRGGSNRIVRHLYWIAALLLFGVSTLACLGLLLQSARGPAIGRLTGVYEAQWRGAHLRPGGPLYARRYDLREGVAKMELGQETSLLLEAPCRVKLTSVSEITLISGRLVAAVSPRAKGLQVRTPTALITDLGTEFGVIAHSDGSTEAHVLKGTINIAIDPERSSQPSSLIVNEQQAMTVDAAGQMIRGGLAARPDLFCLQLPASNRPVPSAGVNLADIVGGGSGRGSGTLDHGIDLGTAQAFEYPVTMIRRARRNEFLATSQFYGIDGVFVPNRALGPVVISSTGLTFSECPDTLGSYYGGPANSGKIYDIPSKQIYTARFNGVSFGTSRHPALNLHPNAGITFDLDQIRQDNPNTPIDRFSAICGIPKDVPQTPFNSADVWVLLDGAVGLHLRCPSDRNVVEPVDVPISGQTRFLTLVTTCTGRADYAWVFFGDPFLGPVAGVQEEGNR